MQIENPAGGRGDAVSPQAGSGAEKNFEKNYVSAVLRAVEAYVKYPFFVDNEEYLSGNDTTRLELLSTTIS